MTELTLPQRLVVAYNYSYEATMNDYSQSSISRAAEQIAELKVETSALGLTPDDLITWNKERGHWEVKRPSLS